ncbi:HIT domain-containing protein [Candidatus Woesearchaeota archaeon]|nr:HIT domain-containing protein [Candidatus Woesearchaeota archaeon]
MTEQQQMSEEQIKALQEKVKNMSPEELKEFQKKQCIFCQIISEKVQSKKIYEDEHVLAILDINPANPGHILIMPKEHYSIMPQIPNDEIAHIFNVTKSLSNSSLRALEAQGSNILVANGVAAGQKAQHFMVHLIPRKENDDLKLEVPQTSIPEKELQKTQEILARALGIKADQKEKIVPSIPLKAEKETVEADFEETIAKEEPTIEDKPEQEVPKKSPAKKKTAQKKKEEPKDKDIEEIPEQGADLDDIARMLGAK